MIQLSAQSVYKAFAEQEVLRDVSFSLEQGSRTGIVGPNGSGKTTLLRILSGETQADAGTVRFSAGLRIGYLRQILPYPQEWTVWETLLDVFRPVFEMEERLRWLEQKMEETHRDPDAFGRYSLEYSDLMERFEEAGGYSYQSSIQGVLAGLGLDASVHGLPLRLCSGGQKSRVALARLLLEQPDLLLLDEPTNHLDLEAIAWLESTLRAFRGTVLVVSHDRWFLDTVCGRILEISNACLSEYEGNYTDYLAQREERYRRQMKAYQNNQKEIRRREAIIARYRSFNREKSVKAARSWEKKLSRMERVERPASSETFRLRLATDRKSGNDVLLTEKLGMEFPGKPLFSDLNLHLRLGDRAALLGPNGVGKTTLLQILCGRLRQTQGAFLLGAGVTVGYYDQQQENLSPEKTVLSEIWDAYPQMTLQEVRDCLGAFLFRGDDAEKSVSDLSGGERGRVSLLKLMLGGYNFLLLDEPTNHLDIDSRQVLEEALIDFPGTVLLVSHDRYFIDSIANRILEMNPEGFVQYPGAWSEYLYHQSLAVEPEKETVAQTKTEQKKERRRDRELKAAFREKKQALRDAEETVTRLEGEMACLEKSLSDPATYDDAFRREEVTEKYRKVRGELDLWMETWTRLSEEMEEQQ